MPASLVQRVHRVGRSDVSLGLYGARAQGDCGPSRRRRRGGTSFTDPATGKLLLYSDGHTVFNGQTHKALDNGTGLNSGRPLIAPAPGGKPNLFCIFLNYGKNAVLFSIADLSADPNGRVTVKTQHLASNTGETLGIVPHANGRALWLLVYNTAATVDDYLVDGPSGVTAKPVSSPTGLTAFQLQHGEVMHASIIHSPDYNTLALGIARYGIAIAKIDRASGKLSDVQLRVNLKGGGVGFSSAFSPDGTKLYYARGNNG